MTKSEYIRLYSEQLQSVSEKYGGAQGVVDKLTDLGGGHAPVLLCWERPPLTGSNWCHRRLFADWVKSEIGLSVPELAPGESPTPLDDTGDLAFLVDMPPLADIVRGADLFGLDLGDLLSAVRDGRLAVGPQGYIRTRDIAKVFGPPR